MRRLLTGVVVAAVVVCALAARAGAQEGSGARQAPQPPAVDAADVSITGRVTARELRFEKVPNTSVEFTGRPKRETVWEAERQNLPPQVQPGVTYRDIGITLRITSVFADIDRIVAEALGEIPPSPDPAPEAAPPAPPRPQASIPSAPPARSPRTASARKGGRR
ncbi:MAG TPA: hypothetical protein VK422_14260 [Pyrinomonadaceae bacterium]|nr:hypothetical protein [Pyrinomonadaceae bacterium]